MSGGKEVASPRVRHSLSRSRSQSFDSCDFRTEPVSILEENSPYPNKISGMYLGEIVKVGIKASDCPPFAVHYNRLVDTSDYFKRCLSSNFKESQDREVKLDLDAQYLIPLGYYVAYLYTNTYTVPDAATLHSPIPRNGEEETRLGYACTRQALLHARIFILGEEILSAGLKKIAIKNLTEVLAVAYKYAHPSVGKNQGWNSAWAEWQGTQDFREYRKFCWANVKPDGKAAVKDPLISARDIKDIAKLIYENTPGRPAPNDGDIRGIIALYCASAIESFRASEDFLALMSTNSDFLHDVMHYIKNGKPIWI